jgi:hypothetical protein
MSDYLLLPFVEFEIRLGTFNAGKFDPCIDINHFKTINSALEKETWKKVEKTHSIDYIHEELRLTENNNGQNNQLIKKEKIKSNVFSLKNSPFDIRLSINQEFKLDSYSNLFDKKNTENVIREKFRHSYINDEFKYELTYIVEQIDCIKKEKHEIEIEILQTNETINWTSKYLNDFVECKIYDLINIVEPIDRNKFNIDLFNINEK